MPVCFSKSSLRAVFPRAALPPAMRIKIAANPPSIGAKPANPLAIGFELANATMITLMIANAIAAAGIHVHAGTIMNISWKSSKNSFSLRRAFIPECGWWAVDRTVQLQRGHILSDQWFRNSLLTSNNLRSCPAFVRPGWRVKGIRNHAALPHPFRFPL